MILERNPAAGATDDSRPPADDPPLSALQRAHGYSNEDLKIVLRPMGAEAQDAVWSMGDDTPIAPFARVPRPVYAFFRQRFAQVTNPRSEERRVGKECRSRWSPYH